jgi:hypothetical protein
MDIHPTDHAASKTVEIAKRHPGSGGGGTVRGDNGGDGASASLLKPNQADLVGFIQDD